ncbi:MAG: FHA domain-containing protein [Elusimicrobia bacterium]|nr:FHA domain-containing protein [Elusimicrobiota bacterium]
MIKILLKFNGALVKEQSVLTEEVTIGRKPENDLVIDNPAVSGRHCRIFKDPEGYYIEDLNSTNGTFLRGHKVSRSPLHHQDEVAIAKHTVIFFNDEEAVSPASAEPPAPVSSDSTVIIAAPPPAVVGPKAAERVAFLRVLPGDSLKPIPLTQLTTYIGRSAQAHVKLKGLFAPDLAACMAKKADGHHLTALKDKYVKLNGDSLMDNTPVPLKEGDLIDVGSLKLLYFLQEVGAPT